MTLAARSRHLAAVTALLLVATLLPAALAPRPAAASPTRYVEMSDGVPIAVNVVVPEHCTEAAPCPTILEMAGYENGSADGKTPSGDVAEITGLPLPLQDGSRASHSVFFDDRYVTIQASVRGTGCSGGEFDLFSWRSALDGRELIDDWIVHQPWSNGEVAIFGHSYSGLTGTFIAATQPRHLKALSASGLIDDLYRGITYPGGVTNYGFPLLWTGAVRPAYDVGGGVGGGLFPPSDTSSGCAANQATKSRTVLNDPLIQGLQDTDNEWWRSRSLINFVERIQVPTHITGAYQDEQTGPRGPAHLFETLPDRISKRLVLTNGDHGTQTDPNIRRDRVAWLDYWMLGAERAPEAFGKANLKQVFGKRDKPTTTTRILLGYQRTEDDGAKFDGIIDSTDYPLPETEWTDLYLSADGSMTFDRAAVEAGDLSWFNGSKRQSYSYQAGRNEGAFFSTPTGPDELELVHTFANDTVVSGPMTATLRVSSSAPDTELFVQLIDRDPETGAMLYLQRGMLRAAHRAVHVGLSDRTDEGRIYRPYRPHTNPTLITPGEPIDYLVEIFPVGHVFRAGHELVVKVHAPPADDNDYTYIAKAPAGVNTLHVDPEHPSSILLPVIPLRAVDVLNPPPAEPCAYNDMRCVKGPEGNT
ncbi:MAG: CocE/NonD family hydrolase [Nitriliruptorales bacterium]